MRRLFLTSLLALGALAGAIGSVEASGHTHYYPYGWYIPKGPCWVRWHGLREPWQPPSATNWTVNNPLPPYACTPYGGAEILFQPLGFLPPPAQDDGAWFYGKCRGQKAGVRQLIPTCSPGYLP